MSLALSISLALYGTWFCYRRNISLNFERYALGSIVNAFFLSPNPISVFFFSKFLNSKIPKILKKKCTVLLIESTLQSFDPKMIGSHVKFFQKRKKNVDNKSIEKN